MIYQVKSLLNNYLKNAFQCDFKAEGDSVASVTGRRHQWQTDATLCLSGSCAARLLSPKSYLRVSWCDHTFHRWVTVSVLWPQWLAGVPSRKYKKRESTIHALWVLGYSFIKFKITEMVKERTVTNMPLSVAETCITRGCFIFLNRGFFWFFTSSSPTNDHPS